MNRSKQILSAIALLLSLFVSSAIAADADFAECRQTFPHSTPPVVHIQEDALPRALCFSGFALLHSGKTHTPIYVVERLNKQDLANASKIKRKDRFYEEARLRSAERARLEDYKHSGYDRGHMAPAGDMGTEESKAQSFSLANMVPQNPQNNQRTWRKIESDTRKYVMRATGDVYVFTGPVYGDSPPTIGKGKVWVPQHLFKLVYDPHTNRAWAHWLDNTATARPGKPISYEELVKRTGIEFLPNRSKLN